VHSVAIAVLKLLYRVGGLQHCRPTVLLASNGEMFAVTEKRFLFTKVTFYFNYLINFFHNVTFLLLLK